MSKIFHALRRATQEDPGFVLPPKLREAPVVDLPPETSAGVADGQEASGTGARPRPDQPGNDKPRALPVRPLSGAPLLPYDGSDPYAAEQYRIIRTKLVQHPRQPKLCAVSSPGPGDGKTITAINVAAALALRGGADVALVDADLRRPCIAGAMEFPNTPGLSNVLAGECDLADVPIQIEQLPNLYVFPAGNPPANPTELLDSGRWREIALRLSRKFRFVIVDAPPMVGIADYALIQAAVDGVILVVRPDHTNRAQCFTVLESLPKDKLIGVALNCVPEWFLTGRQNRNHYYYVDAGAGAKGK